MPEAQVMSKMFNGYFYLSAPIYWTNCKIELSQRVYQWPFDDTQITGVICHFFLEDYFHQHYNCYNIYVIHASELSYIELYAFISYYYDSGCIHWPAHCSRSQHQTCYIELYTRIQWFIFLHLFTELFRKDFSSYVRMI